MANVEIQRVHCKYTKTYKVVADAHVHVGEQVSIDSAEVCVL